MSQIIRVVTAGLCLSLAPATAWSGPLDGKTFAVKVSEPGKKKAGPDKLVFARGKFTSTDCTKYGFNAVSYKVKRTAAGWSFTAQPVSAKEGRLDWSGEVEGKKVSGTMKWVKKGQKTITYLFSGTLVR